MRKAIAFALTIIIAITAFVGCKPSKKPVGDLNELTKITLWHYYNGGIKTQFDELVQKFNETVGKEKKIIVDAYSQGGVNELADALFSSANKDVGSKEMPNIFAAYPDSALRLDNLGVVAALDKYFTKDELAQYRSEFLDDGRFDKNNSLKIIPFAKSTELLFINTTAFNKFAEASKVTINDLSTWEGLAKTADKYYKWSNGKAMFGIDSMSNFMIIATKQLGKEMFVNVDGTIKLNLDSQDAKKLWETFYVPFITGHYAAVGRFRSDDMKSGSIIMFTGSNSSASFFPKTIESGKDTSSTITSGVVPYPHFEGKEKIAVHQGAGMVVSKSNEKEQKACAEFLKWFTDPEQNLKFAALTSYFPVKNEALTYDKTIEQIGSTDENDIKVQTNKALFKMFDSYKLYAPRPFKNSFETRNIINDSLIKKAKADLSELNKQSNKNDKQKMTQHFISDSNFNDWYTQFSTEINNALKK